MKLYKTVTYFIMQITYKTNKNYIAYPTKCCIIICIECTIIIKQKYKNKMCGEVFSILNPKAMAYTSNVQKRLSPMFLCDPDARY